MKHFFILMLLLLGCYNSFAFEYKGVYYRESDGGAIVSKPETGGTYSGEIVIPEEVVCKEYAYEPSVTYHVVGIDENAFEESYGLTKITINAPIKDLKINKCYAQEIVLPQLKSIELENAYISTLDIPSTADDVKLYGCPSLYTLVVPGTVSHLGLSNCSVLGDLVIQESKEKLYLGISDDTPVTDLTISRVVNDNNDYLSSLQNLVNLHLGDNITHLPSLDGKTKLKTVEGNGITIIERETFNGTTSLKTVSFPNLKTIRDWAFKDSGIKSIELPNTLDSIGSSAFCGAKLTNIVLPSSLKNVGENAFENCEDLTSLTIKGNTSFERNVFENCSSLSSVSLPNDLESLGEEMFCGCSSLVEISLPHDLKVIPKSAFRNCKALQRAYFNGNVEAIEDHAFEGCSNLQSLTLPTPLKSIGIHAFDDCESMAELVLPNSLEYVGGGAFCGVNLTKLTFSGSLKEWLGINFDYLIIDHDSPEDAGTGYPTDTNPITHAQKFYIGAGLVTDLEIPANVNAVNAWSFTGYRGLKTVTIPSWVKRVGEGAFLGCLLDKVTIQAENLQIDKYGFYVSGWIQEEGIHNVVISKNLKQVTGEGDVPTANAIDYDGTIEEWLNIKFNLKKEMFAIDGQGILRINGKQVNEIIIPEDMTEIHDYQFAGMALSTVYVPKSLKRIGKYAFAWCHDLERVQYSSVKTPASAKKCQSKTAVRQFITIGDCAFLMNKKLTDISFAEVVDSVGNRAFYSTAWLDKQPDGMVIIGKSLYEYKGEVPASVAIPEGIICVCSEAFKGQSKLTDVTFPESLEYISDSAFEGCIGITSVEFPEKLQSIGDYAFSQTGLTQINISSNVMRIKGDGAFSKTPIKSVILEDGENELDMNWGMFGSAEIAYIGRPGFFALSGSGLKEVTLGKYVKEIPLDFVCSHYIEKFTILSSIPPVVGREGHDYFSEDTYDNCKLIVPKESLEAYKTAPIWKYFTNVEESEVSGIKNVLTSKDSKSLTYGINGCIATSNGIVIEKKSDGSVRKYVRK